MNRTRFVPADNAVAYLLTDLPSLYGIGKDHWYAAIKAGEVKAKKAGRRTIVEKPEADRYVASLPDAREENARRARFGRGGIAR
jgi:hypothetical protein